MYKYNNGFWRSGLGGAEPLLDDALDAADEGEGADGEACDAECLQRDPRRRPRPDPALHAVHLDGEVDDEIGRAHV